MKINSATHQHDTERTHESGIVAIDSCFALFGARQYGATTRESSDEKYPRTLILSPDPELSTPTESRHTTCLLGGKSPSVKLMSRRENKELAKTNLKNMDRTMQELTSTSPPLTKIFVRRKTLNAFV